MPEVMLLPLVEQVGAIGMTVSDMDASVDFYSKVLSFEKVSDVEVTGRTMSDCKASLVCMRGGANEAGRRVY